MIHHLCRIGSPGIPRKYNYMLACNMRSATSRCSQKFNLRVKSTVKNRSPRVRHTASARIAREIVYPGHKPAPGIGTLVSSACSPTWRVPHFSMESLGGTKNPHVIRDCWCQYKELQQRSAEKSVIGLYCVCKSIPTYISGLGFHSLKFEYAAGLISTKRVKNGSSETYVGVPWTSWIRSTGWDMVNVFCYG